MRLAALNIYDVEASVVAVGFGGFGEGTFAPLSILFSWGRVLFFALGSSVGPADSGLWLWLVCSHVYLAFPLGGITIASRASLPIVIGVALLVHGSGAATVLVREDIWSSSPYVNVPLAFAVAIAMAGAYLVFDCWSAAKGPSHPESKRPT